MHFQPTSPLIPILLGKEKDVRYSIDTLIRFWPVIRRSLFFFQIFQNCSIFQFLCLFVNFWESGVHSYQFYWLQSTSSPILKFRVCWSHLAWNWFPLCYSKSNPSKQLCKNWQIWRSWNPPVISCLSILP